MHPLLGVNIDHIASLRQARYRGDQHPALFAEPDPVRAVAEAELGGADIITVHLREDRRHINDRDVELIVKLARVRVNLEMGATEEMLKIARQHHVHMSTLVPEGRQEVTTEGGLDVAGQVGRLTEYVGRLKDATGHRGGGMTVSAFIDADARQIEASKAAGFDACEIHTGPFAHAFALAGGDGLRPSLAKELARLMDACHIARAVGLRLHAGHGLNYANVGVIAAVPGMRELHIGHSIISRGAFVGLRSAVAEMRAAIRGA